MTTFKPGDKVRCVSVALLRRDTGLVHGREYTVQSACREWLAVEEDPGISYNPDRFELLTPSSAKPEHEFRVGQPVTHVDAEGCTGVIEWLGSIDARVDFGQRGIRQCWLSDLTPSSPAKEAWVPVMGRKARINMPGNEFHGRIGEVTSVGSTMSALFGLGCWSHEYLEPAPSESKPESPAVRGIDPAFDAPPEFKEACRVFNKQNGPRKWDTDRYHGIVKSDLDTRIAAARAEMALSSEERKRKLGRFDGGPWQVWPKGDERNEP